VRRFAERPAKLTTEVGPRETRGPGQGINTKRLEVASVRKVLRAQQMTGGRGVCHGDEVCQDDPRRGRRGGPAFDQAPATRASVSASIPAKRIASSSLSP